ncbi:MAG: proline dehydrogenase family protein [Saprospiraceae bacterium]
MGNIIMKKKISIDFNNTAIAFSGKTDKQLKKMTRLFQLMNQSWLVNIGSKIGVAALNLNLPFVEKTIKHTIFEQFCGGTTLLDSQPTITELSNLKTLTILDYGAEAKISELDFNGTMNEMIRAIDFAEQSKSVPVISMKITGISRFALLEKIQNGEALTEAEKTEFKNVNKRLDAICYAAHHKKVGVFVDAEESWIQDTIDFLVKKVMKRYNKEQVIVYNTFQMYRHDRLQYLIDSYEEARKEGYLLGAKLVRGAYMEKERARAATLGKPSPIQPNKEATDNDYDTAIQFCVEHYTHIGSCNATHNANSCILQAGLIDQKNIKKDHPHLNFCQLYGMSDNLTFNLADAGYNVAKYVPYGPVQDVVPYLVRRAQENSAISGDMNREYKLIVREMKRRGLK